MKYEGTTLFKTETRQLTPGLMGTYNTCFFLFFFLPPLQTQKNLFFIAESCMLHTIHGLFTWYLEVCCW